MRNILFLSMLGLAAPASFAQGAPTLLAADQPYAREYYYKVHWGGQQRFQQLFPNIIYPHLKKNPKSERIV